MPSGVIDSNCRLSIALLALMKRQQIHLIERSVPNTPKTREGCAVVIIRRVEYMFQPVEHALTANKAR